MKSQYPSYRKQGVVWIEESLSPETKEIVENYLAEVGITAGKRKLVDYRLYILQFVDIMEKPIYELIPKDLKLFWALVNQDETRTISTKNNIKTVVKRFVRWYYKKDIEMRDQLVELKLKTIIVNEKKINKNTLVKDFELELMARACRSWKEKAVLITAYESGARPHELRTAKWGSINWDAKTISLYSNKTESARVIPLNEAIIHLKRWRQEFEYPDVSDEDYIFPSNYERNKPVVEWTFRTWIIDIGKRAGIKRTINPYLLRHTIITKLKKMGVDDLDRKKFAGHTPTSKMQAVYVAMDDEDMIENVVSKLYHVEEIPEGKKEELEKRIKQLEEDAKQNKEIANKADFEIKKAMESFKLMRKMIMDDEKMMVNTMEVKR